MIRGTAAVAALSWREAWRSRLWLLPLAGMLLIAVIAPRAAAADAGGAIQLIAAAASAIAGFCGILIAALVPAQQSIRDRDGRIALTALPKPLPRAGWLIGRWLGALALAGTAALAVAAAGSAAVAWRAGGVPQMRSAQAAESFHRLTGLGEAVAAPPGAVRLAGAAGDGARWRFQGLAAARTDGYEVLVQARCSAADGGLIEGAAVRLVALASDGRALPLVLDPASPYGRPATDTLVPGATCWLVDRASDRRSLAADWARLRLPPEAIAADGTLTVQLIRLDPAAVVQLDSASCAVARPAGLQPLHAARAELAALAGPAVVAAAALAVAAFASLPVALLAALTLAFAGHLLGTVREALGEAETSRAFTRLLELLLAALPDLSVTGQGARLAAGEAVGWGQVGGAWLAVAPHLAILLALGWWALQRREL